MGSKADLESAAEVEVLAAPSPSTAAVSPQPADMLEPESATDMTLLLEAALQPERTVMP